MPRRRPADAADAMPLPALLGRVQHRYVTEFDSALGDVGYPDLSLAHGANVLRHLAGQQALSSAELVRRSTITKQAMSQQVRHLVQQDVVREEPSTDDARVKLLRLTPRGEAAYLAYRTTFVELESRWRSRYGDADVDVLKQVLQRIWDA